MSAQMEKLENNQVKLTLTVGNDVFQNALDKVYRKSAGKFNIPGFRAGKAPRRVIEQHYGPSVFWDDAINDVFPEAYSEAVDECEVFPVDNPDVTIKDINDDGLTFEAIVTVKPEVTLGKYTGIRFKGVAYTVTDEDVEAELKRAQDKAARLVDIEDRAVQNGDVVGLDYSGSVDEVKFEGGTAEGQTLEIGSGMFIPGFEEQMVGMAIGETRDITVKFPDEYHAEELKGKEAVFTVKVNGIQAKELPELDDEFAKDVSEFDTLEDYKNDIRSNLEEQNKKRKDREDENKLIDKIVANAEVDIPECMITRQIDYMLREMEYTLMYQGMRMEDYLRMINKTVEELRAESREDAEKRVKTQLVMETIRTTENIQAEEEDIEAEIAKRAETAKKTVEEYKENMRENEKAYISDQIIVDKTMDFLKKNNTITK